MENPLQNYSGLFLFPQTLSSFPNPPSHPIHLISLPVRDPDNLVEQAKSILEDTTSQNDTSDLPFHCEKFLERREPRPGLDRKRRKFSLHPSSSVSSNNLEPTLDINNLKDPAEFFKTFERLRNAKREIAKQNGTFLPDFDLNEPLVKRPRRPGIPGRNKIVKYTHLYPTTSSQEIGEDGFVDSSVQTQRERIQDPVDNSDDGLLAEVENENFASQQIEKDDAREEMEIEGSVVGAEKRIGKLLDELLSCDYEQLDGDGATNLLQDRLQIKPIAIEKLHIPEISKIQRTGVEPAREGLQKYRNVLSDINNMLKVTRNKTPGKKLRVENSASSVGSPTPPRSPFESLSLLRRLLQPRSPNDPFSAAAIDQLNLTNDSPSTEVEKNNSGNSKCLVIEKDHNVVHSSSSPSLTAGNITGSTDIFENHNVMNPGSENEMHPSDSCPMLEKDNAGHQNNKENVQNNEPSESVDMVNDVLNEPSVSPQPHAVRDDSAVEKLDEISNPCDTLKDVIEEHTVDGCSGNQIDGAEEIQDASLEQPIEINQESSASSLIEEINVKSNAKRGKRKVFNKRQSLAAAGTSWDAGMRRSTRIKSRPLEYWRGERFLYGRIHLSLPTIIGIKCESPGEVKGKGVLKVKSFVSSQYKDLIELAAL